MPKPKTSKTKETDCTGAAGNGVFDTLGAVSDTPPPTPTYAREYFTVSNDDLTIEQNSKDPRAVQQGMFNRLDLDARNSSDLGSYICDYMDPEFDEIMYRTRGKVFIDHSEYPQTSEFGEAVPAMIQAWYNGTPLSEQGAANHKIIGTVTIGSSEAIMLGLIAHTQNWWNAWNATYSTYPKNPPYIYGRPFLMYARDVHTCWDKYSLYYNVPALVWNLSEGDYTIDPSKVQEYLQKTLYEIYEEWDNSQYPGTDWWPVMTEAMRLQTVGWSTSVLDWLQATKLGELICCVGGVIGTTFTGQGDDIEGLNTAVTSYGTTATGFDIPIHVDAASGGFVVPFTNPDEADFKWTFSLSNVSSINVSNHKFGMVYPGCGTVVFRDENVVPDELIYKITYLGGNFTDYTVNFSRGSAMVLGAYYNLKRFGLDGYEKINTQCVQNARYLADKINAVTNGSQLAFSVINYADTTVYPMCVWELNPGITWSLSQLSTMLQQYGWKLPAYQLPFTSSQPPDGTWVMRVVTRQDVSAEKIDILVDNIQTCVDTLESSTAALAQTEGGNALLGIEQKRVAYQGSGDYV